MKKTAALLLSIILTLSLAAAAFADGELTADRQSFYIEDGYYYQYAFGYARVRNTGDAPVCVNGGLMEVLGSDEVCLNADKSPTVYCRYLAPGEYGYVKCTASLDSDAQADSFTLTLAAKSTSKAALRLPCTAEWLPDLLCGQRVRYDTMQAVFTNTTQDTLFDIKVVFALLDADDNILALEDTYLSSRVGIAPGSTVTVRAYINDTTAAAYTQAGLTPDHVDALVFIDN